MKEYYWNGHPCKRVEFLNAEILETPFEEGKMPWWKPLEGTAVQVIKIWASYGDPFIVDNTDGLGYRKLISGGMFTDGSRHYYGVNLSITGPTPEDQIAKVFSPEIHDLIEQKNEAYWSEHNPEGWARIKSIKLLAKSHNAYNRP